MVVLKNTCSNIAQTNIFRIFENILSMSKQKKLGHRYFWTALLNIQLLLGNVYAKTFDKNIICTEVLPCATPTVASVTSSSPTCTGVQANNNGSIMLTGVANGSKYGIVAGSTYINGVTFADATAFSGSSLTINNLPNSYTNQTYTVRIFGSDGTCYVDKNATLNASVCTIPTCSTSGVSKVSDINNMLDCGNGNAPLALYLKGVGNEYHTIAPGTSPKIFMQ
jgi:hypothetical protein